jgi:hypothetical protein
MAFFRDKFGEIERSPSRSIYGLDHNDNTKLIAPIDLVVLTISGGNFPRIFPNLPPRLTTAEIRVDGGPVIGEVLSTLALSTVNVYPVVKLKKKEIEFTNQLPISSNEILVLGEEIFFVNNRGQIIGGKLNSTIPELGRTYLDGSFTVDAFSVSFSISPNSSDNGSMVIVKRLNKSLGMLLGFSNSTLLVFPAFNI